MLKALVLCVFVAVSGANILVNFPSDCTGPEWVGKMGIQLYSATNIPSGDDSSPPDLYVEAYFKTPAGNDLTLQQRMAWNGVKATEFDNANPVWNTWGFYCVTQTTADLPVYLRLVDDDGVAGNSVVGSVNMGTLRESEAVSNGTYGKLRDVYLEGSTTAYVTAALTLFPSLTWDEALSKGFNTGDIILYSGDTTSGEVIKQATGSAWSHVGFVYVNQTNGRNYTMEASTNKAELYDCGDGQIKSGVELLDLQDKIFCGYYSLVAIRRIRYLPPALESKYLEFYNSVYNVPYEEGLWDLALSAVGGNWDPDLSSLFCSEFIAYCMQALGLIESNTETNNYTPKDFSSEKWEHGLLGGAEYLPEIYIRNPQPLGQYQSCKSQSNCNCGPPDPCYGKEQWESCDDGYAVTYGTICINSTGKLTCQENAGSCAGKALGDACDPYSASTAVTGVNGTCVDGVSASLVCLSPEEVLKKSVSPGMRAIPSLGLCMLIVMAWLLAHV